MKNFWNNLFTPKIAQFKENQNAMEEGQKQSQDNDLKKEELVFKEENIVDEPMLQQQLKSKKRVNRPAQFEMLFEAIKTRTRMRSEKIDGFRFSTSFQPAVNVSTEIKYDLIGPQAQKKPTGMGSMASQNMQILQQQAMKKSSKFSMDIQYMATRIPKQGDKPWALISHHDSTGTQVCMISKQFSDKLAFNLQANYHSKSQCEWNSMLSYEGDDFRTSLMYGNPMSAMSYVQSIGRNTQLGFNLSHIGARFNMTDLKIAGRFLAGRSMYHFQYDPFGQIVGLGTQTMIDKRTIIATEFANHSGIPMDPERKTKAVLSVTRNLENSKMKFILDSKWNMKSFFSLQNAGGLMKLNLYAAGNMFEDDYKFGYGVNFGQ